MPPTFPITGTAGIQAEDDAAALKAAKAYDLSEVTTDAEWEYSVCKHIVHIEDPEGNMIVYDIPLDDHFLGLQSEKAEMLEALESCEDVLSDLARLRRRGRGPAPG